MSELELKTAPETLEGIWQHDGVQVTGLCIPPTIEDFAWSGPKHFKDGDQGFIRRRVQEFERYNVVNILAPNVSKSTTKVVNQEWLSTHVQLTETIVLHGNARPKGAADAVVANPKEVPTFYANTLGCITFAMIAEGIVILGHLNRRNSIDHMAINHGLKKSRDHESILDAGAAYFDALGIPRARIGLCVFGAIHPRGFRHAFDPKAKQAYNFERGLFKRVQEQGYSTNVMEETTGCFDLDALSAERAAMLRFGDFKSLFTLPFEGDFPTTRDSRSMYTRAGSTSLMKAQLI